MPSYFSFIFQKLFLIIFISICLNLFGNCGSSSLHFANNQRQSSGNSYGEFGQYYGNNGRNGNELELSEWNGGGGGGRRRSNTRILSEQQQQYKKNLNYEIVTNAAFTFEDYCTERCQIPCSPLFVFQERDKDPKLQFNCAKLKPPERKLHEKLVGAISGASIFEFFVAGIIALAIAICCVCSCYQCLCKSSPQIVLRNRQQQINLEEENELNKAIPPNGVLVNGGISTTTSTGVSPEHDHLINDKIPHIDEGIHPAPLTNNQQQKQQQHTNYIKPGHHHYVKTNLFKGEQQQHSIV
ncbi:unnamed protein product [Meloidogyne enterolobii]|uniref:Uncharacterized protein n=1 Tax=Meloidogyne enterolobii TaxID=390850 RepID=A0ACB0YNN5_MELEN